MNFNEYQKKAVVYALPHIKHNISYMALGLCGESGEVAEKIKKVLRDNDGVWTNDTYAQLAFEIGDVLWYLSQLSRQIGIPLNEIAVMNLEKLENRKENGKLGGSGDSR
jgi:NTP pyrophosphatase (non-canonical NTP hydrolase)